MHSYGATKNSDVDDIGLAIRELSRIADIEKKSIAKLSVLLLDTITTIAPTSIKSQTTTRNPQIEKLVRAAKDFMQKPNRYG